MPDLINIVKEDKKSNKYHIIYTYDDYNGKKYKDDKASILYRMRRRYYPGVDKLPRKKFILPPEKCGGKEVTFYFMNISIRNTFPERIKEMKGNIVRLPVEDKYRDLFGTIINLIEEFSGTFVYHKVQQDYMTKKLSITREIGYLVNKDRIMGNRLNSFTKKEANEIALKEIEKMKKGIDVDINGCRKRITREESEIKKLNERKRAYDAMKSKFMDVGQIIKRAREKKEK